MNAKSGGGQVVAVDGRTLQGLLALEDEAFLDAAYGALLRRPPDPGGLAYYRERLAAGHHKLDVLRQIRSSPEAQRVGATIPGLDEALRERKTGWIGFSRGGIRQVFASRAAFAQGDSGALLQRIRQLEQANEVAWKLLHEQALRWTSRGEQDTAHQQLVERIRVLESKVQSLVDERQRSAVVPKVGTAQQAARTPTDERVDFAFPTVDNPKVSIIIPVYGKLDYTLRCLRSIAAHPPRATFEVIVVDDKSPDDTQQVLVQVPGLRLVINEVNRGFVRSCNRGAQAASGHYVYFLNNDTEVKAGWLDELLATFTQFPNAGLVGSKLLYPDGKLQEAGGILWSDGSAWNFGRNQDPARSEFNYAREVDYCSGASIILTKQLFMSLGMFDEIYCPAYCEDTDLAFAVRRHGKQVIYQPKSEVIHYEGVSNGTDTSQGIKAYQVTNGKTFFERWKDVLKREHFANAEKVFLAKDKSTLRKTMLVIDHYVPQPDQDAGSRTMVQFMSLFQKQGMAVKFWPENLWRDPKYTELLERCGIEVFHGAEYAGQFGNWMRENGRCVDYVLLSRPHISVNFIDSIRAHSSAKVLYYGHDIHFLRLERELALHWKDETVRERDKFKKFETDLWPRLDAIYYPSVEEREYVRNWLRARALANKVSAIPVYAFDSFPDAPWSDLGKRSGLMFVAGFRHTPNVGAAVWFVSKVLPLIQQALPGTKLRLVGSNPPAEVLSLAGPDVEVTGHVSDQELENAYLTTRVTLAPLLVGGGMKGKVIESMRFGTPCVTTPVGAQGLSAAGGFLPVCESPQAFADAVVQLLRDDQEWTRISVASQQFARDNFSMDAMWKVIGEDIEPKPHSSKESRFDRDRTQ